MAVWSNIELHNASYNIPNFKNFAPVERASPASCAPALGVICDRLKFSYKFHKYKPLKKNRF